MIAEKMTRELLKLKMVLSREDGDIYHIAPRIIETLENEIERVRGLEGAAIMDCPETPLLFLPPVVTAEGAAHAAR